LALVNNRNTPAKGAERLAGTIEQSARSRAHGVDDKITIRGVQQKNETDVRMAGVQNTEGINELVATGGPVAEEHNVDRGRPQGSQAIGALAAATGNLHASLAAKGAAQYL
jgi:hypothetical protein